MRGQMMIRHETVANDKKEDGTECGKRKALLWTEKFCTTSVWLIFTAVLMLLVILSISSTCSVYGKKEVVQYKQDFLVFHAVCWCIVTAATVFLTRKGTGAYRRVEEALAGKMVFLVIMLLYGMWIAITLFWPVFDQRMSYEAALGLINGDYSAWVPAGFSHFIDDGITSYAFTYPSQNGLILFFTLFALVFHNATPYAVQYFNILFLAVGVLYVCRLFRELFPQERIRGIEIMMLVFLPFAFYITFVYGTVPGFAFASAAMYYEHRFLKTGGFKPFFLSAASICAAILLKNNYLIVLVAMLIYLLTWSVFHKSLRFFCAAVVLVLLYIGSGRAVNLYLETVTGAPTSKGVPMLAWVEMGLQEGSRGPGWYNGYNVTVFRDNNQDSEQAKEAVKNDLEETIQDFAGNPKKAVDFFIRKTKSIWVEPTFQSLWIQENKGGSWLIPGFTESLFKEGGFLNGVYISFFNYVQSLVYAGTLCFFLLCRKKITWEQLMPAVLFIGGFLFHLVWEAKGQYSVYYFVLLIPYAVMGVRTVAERITDTGKKVG